MSSTPLEEAAQRRVIRSALGGRRLAYAGAIVAPAAAIVAVTAVRRAAACGGSGPWCYRDADPGRPVLSSVAGHDAGPEGSSSIGRAPVSKTGGWGFESLLPCSPLFRAEDMFREPTDKASPAATGPDRRRGRAVPAVRRPPPTRRRPRRRGSKRTDRACRSRLVEFAREVRNELAKVAWPNRREVVKYTDRRVRDPRFYD